MFDDVLLMIILFSKAIFYFDVADCTFPATWSGRWFQQGKEGPLIVNSTHFLDKKCSLKVEDKFLTYEGR